MKDILNVHISQKPDPKPLAHLLSRLGETVHLTYGSALPGPSDYAMLIAGRPSREQLCASSQLSTLVIPWAGLPETTHALLLEFPHIAVHNLHHNAAPVAELALTLLLAAAKSVLPLDRALRAHNWEPRYQSSTTLLLEGKTALILGYGAIGQRVARMCQGLGMRVLATRRNPRQTECSGVEIYPPTGLPNLLPRTHALLVCLPLTAATRGLIGAQELSLMPPGGVLVNVGRGPVVDEEALYEALRTQHLRAAGIDVWYAYPKDKASRRHTPVARCAFHTLDNVVMSPHRGGALGNQQSEFLRMEALARVINAAANGTALPNRVDLNAGY